MIKLVFFGTPNFAIPSLYALHKSTNKILAVVTVPDKPAGRGLINTASPVKLTAQKLDYPIFQPHDLKDPNFLSIINKFDADYFVVVAYRIIPEEMIAIPHKGCINIHASLLPKYRGPAPIHRAILNGENETGVTTFLIQKTIDTGDILLQEPFSLNNIITTGEAYDKLANIGSKLIVTTLERLNKNQIIPEKQKHIIATSAPKISSSDCMIHWSKSAETIHNQIRAFSPHPGAFTFFQNKRIKLYTSELKLNNPPSILQPGKIQYINHCLQIGTGSSVIHLREIQAEGKKRMPVKQFVSGCPQINGEHFG